MKLSSFVLTCLAVIVHETSGELIPGRIQAPRVKRESVLNVQSPTALDHTGIHMERLHPARFVRWAHPQPGYQNPVFISGVPDLRFLTGGLASELTSADEKRRRRAENLPGRRQISRAPTGTLRQPIKRSAPPSNLPGP